MSMLISSMTLYRPIFGIIGNIEKPLLVAASIITVASVIPYLRDILRGTTRPNIVPWLTWTILTAIAAIAEIAAHEYTTAIFTTLSVAETGLVVILGLKYGYAKYGFAKHGFENG